LFAAQVSTPTDIGAMIGAIGAVGSLREAEALAERLLAMTSFRHHALVRFSREPETRLVRQLVFTSVSREIVNEYERHLLASGSRAPAAARAAALPFLWDRLHPARRPAGSPDVRAVLARAGIMTGVALPLGAPQGARGLLMLGGDRRAPKIDELAIWTLAANGLFDRVVTICERDTPAGDFRLTSRERQCLMWTSAGKTSAEIAAILNLSEHTVNQHIAASAQKLGAMNRTQAVAKAIRLRVID
jgi:LuxR family quorum sensing-dependent transcriptional regulator